MAVVHPIGIPENDSKRIGIAFLAQHLPPEYLIFHNLELPAPSGLPYEYDMIVVGQYAVYVVELKGYRGRITGNAYEWKLESGAIYKSPIPLTNKKAKVVATQLARYDRGLQNVWIQSIIILTDDRAHVQLNDPQADRVLHLQEAVAYILDPRRLPIPPPSLTGLTRRIGDAIAHQFRPLHRLQTIGDYRILETIGKNNLYTTLLAEHRLIRTRGRFTLKVYTFNLYASDEERRKQEEWMLRDANALLHLANHSNIVQAYPPFPWHDNQLVLPLEWVEGYSLRGLLSSDTVLSRTRKLNLIRQVCTGLGHAHEHGVIHRDLRPENVIIQDDGPVKLVNFDCARVMDEQLQTIATRVGRQLNERYIAPEVWQNASQASPVSDMYAVGIMLFELLTGQPPYQKIKELFASAGLPHRASELNSELTSDVDEVLARMCAFIPSERYQTMAEAIEDLAIIE